MPTQPATNCVLYLGDNVAILCGGEINVTGIDVITIFDLCVVHVCRAEVTCMTAGQMSHDNQLTWGWEFTSFTRE